MKKNAAIYHFTNGSNKRPIIYKKQLKILKSFAVSHGFVVKEIYCDKSLRKCEQSEFSRLMSEIDKYDAIIVKDLYHIYKNTMKCIGVIKNLLHKNIQIHSIDNGTLLLEDTPFDKPLRVASYCCRFGTPDEIKQINSVHNDILKLFIKKKTNWTLIQQYFDESEHQKDGEQIELKKLIQNRDKYDLLIVHNLNNLHWRTSNFCKIQEQLHFDIFSLQEGLIKFYR